MAHVHEKERGQDLSDLSDGFLFAKLREFAHSVLWANLMVNMLDVDMFAVWNFSKAQAPWPYQSCPCSETHVKGNVRCVNAYHLMASRVIDIAGAGSDISVRKDRFGDCGACFICKSNVSRRPTSSEPHSIPRRGWART